MVFQRNSARGRMIERFIRWIVLSILRTSEALAISIVFNLQYFSEKASWTTGKAVFFPVIRFCMLHVTINARRSLSPLINTRGLGKIVGVVCLHHKDVSHTARLQNHISQ